MAPRVTDADRKRCADRNAYDMPCKLDAGHAGEHAFSILKLRESDRPAQLTAELAEAKRQLALARAAYARAQAEAAVMRYLMHQGIGEPLAARVPLWRELELAVRYEQTNVVPRVSIALSKLARLDEKGPA